MHMFALHYVSVPRINRHLETWRSGNIHHSIRTAGSQTPMQLYILGLLNMRGNQATVSDDSDDLRYVYKHEQIDCEQIFCFQIDKCCILHNGHKKVTHCLLPCQYWAAHALEEMFLISSKDFISSFCCKGLLIEVLKNLQTGTPNWKSTPINIIHKEIFIFLGHVDKQYLPSRFVLFNLMLFLHSHIGGV